MVIRQTELCGRIGARFLGDTVPWIGHIEPNPTSGRNVEVRHPHHGFLGLTRAADVDVTLPAIDECLPC